MRLPPFQVRFALVQMRLFLLQLQLQCAHKLSGTGLACLSVSCQGDCALCAQPSTTLL